MNMARERKSHGREIIKLKALPNSRAQKNKEEADEEFNAAAKMIAIPDFPCGPWDSFL